MCLSRNCGRIFCSECTNQSVPIPHQLLDEAVRVCSPCYKKISSYMCEQAAKIDILDGTLSLDSFENIDT